MGSWVGDVHDDSTKPIWMFIVMTVIFLVGKTCVGTLQQVGFRVVIEA